MITVERDELQEYRGLVDNITRRHVTQHDDKILDEILLTKRKPGEVVLRGFFRTITDTFTTTYIQYILGYHIINQEIGLIAVTLKRLIIFDSFIEYEAAKFRTLNEVKAKDQNGLHFN